MPVRKLQAAPTITGAYSSGDAVGGKLTFGEAAYVAGTGGEIESAVIIDKSGTGTSTDLYLFDADFTAAADNAAFSINAADLTKFVGVINFTTWIAQSGGASVTKALLELGYRCGPGTSLYGQLVTRGTPTYTAGDLVVTLIARTERE